MAAGLTRRTAIAGASGLAAAGTLGRSAKAAPTKITLLTSWFAEAEHGGFYQAKATGLYEKAGLDVVIRMGGPQVNGMQLLTGGGADIILGYDIQVLSAIEKAVPVTAVGRRVPVRPAGLDDACRTSPALGRAEGPQGADRGRRRTPRSGRG